MTEHAECRLDIPDGGGQAEFLLVYSSDWQAAHAAPAGLCVVAAQSVFWDLGISGLDLFCKHLGIANYRGKPLASKLYSLIKSQMPGLSVADIFASISKRLITPSDFDSMRILKTSLTSRTGKNLIMTSIS